MSMLPWNMKFMSAISDFSEVALSTSWSSAGVGSCGVVMCAACLREGVVLVVVYYSAAVGEDVAKRGRVPTTRA